MYLFLLSKK